MKIRNTTKLMEKIKQDNFTIRRGQRNDLSEVKNIFVETIKSVCIADYNEVQINVWTSSVNDKQRWNDVMTNQIVFIAQIDKKIVGFSSLANKNYIDLLYVHKDYQRLGVALKLYKAIEEQAIEFKQKELNSDVSKTAKSFFELIGFKVIKEQTVLRQKIEFTNFKMTKKLEEI